ncbi:MAG: mannonate dehydratase [Clostridiales bacterium]|jgi:mannonate dehydratase|nr:mannonate dehydratase [Clostridiales bacterium]
MKMSFRWFGGQDDSVTLAQIRQIPGMKGVVSSLYHVPVGEEWSKGEIQALKAEVESAGLLLLGIESVNIHENIKLGAPDRDKYIAAYRNTIRNLGECGVDLICYNFMPVLDWLRTDLAALLPDGSRAMAYDDSLVKNIAPEDMVKSLDSQAGGFMLPGWEPERLAETSRLVARYKGVTEADLLANMGYFINAVIPECEKYNVKLAVHPDDPPWSIFGLPRIVRDRGTLKRILALSDSPMHGLTLCTGSLGSNPDNDLPALIREFGGRINFVHMRNLKFGKPGCFSESAHLSEEGSLDMFAIAKALTDVGFDGVVRPDHGRMIWGEQARAGYGLYDRALGACYIAGLFEAIIKMRG